MKFATYSALVLAIFLGETEAVTLRQLCPGDDSKLKTVLKALADEPAKPAACPCGSAACGGCGAAAPAAPKDTGKAAVKAVKKLEKKLEDKADKKEN